MGGGGPLRAAMRAAPVFAMILMAAAQPATQPRDGAVLLRYFSCFVTDPAVASSISASCVAIIGALEPIIYGATPN